MKQIYQKTKKLLIPLLLFVVIFVLFIIPKEKPLLIPLEDTNKTIGWKEYINSEFSFSFKYPEGELSNFSVVTNGIDITTLEQVAFQKKIKETNSPPGYNVIFEAGAQKFDGSVTDFKKQFNETKDLRTQQVKLKNYQGIKVTNVNEKEDAYFVFYFFKENGIIYSFSIISDDPILVKANEPLLQEILSTTKLND